MMVNMIVFNYTTGGLTERELKNYNKYNLSVYSKLYLLISVIPMTPVMPLSTGSLLTPINLNITNDVREISASFIPIKKSELLNTITGHGLKIEYRFTRSQHLVSAYLVTIELTFSNESSEPVKEIQIGVKVNLYNL